MLKRLNYCPLYFLKPLFMCSANFYGKAFILHQKSQVEHHESKYLRMETPLLLQAILQDSL